MMDFSERKGAFAAIVLTAALSGAFVSQDIRAFAAATITGLDIVDGSIKTVDIGDKQVTSAKLATDSVDGSKIKNNSIRTSDYGDATVTSGKIKDGTIQRQDLAAGVLPTGASSIIFGSCQIEINFSPPDDKFSKGDVCPAPAGTDGTWKVVATMNNAGAVDMWLTMAEVQDPDEGPGGISFFYHVNSDHPLTDHLVTVGYILYK